MASLVRDQRRKSARTRRAGASLLRMTRSPEVFGNLRSKSMVFSHRVSLICFAFGEAGSRRAVKTSAFFGGSKPPPYNIDIFHSVSSCKEKRTGSFKTLRPLFLNKHCFCVHRSDFILSICRRFARLDIFALRQIRYVFATLKLDMI